ncbi:beta-lactamase family protein [Lysobacter sp. GX 14042]|uniref:serine hydrolase domain-containing protein n=1 Tax=Lysobacter sp. GX 14042 TaxID=2907155 RepID=UPI001F230C64|nr:serine hydrolase domain-containing protein [Lysobacter sp. GX 14042]MCE7031330.1 beta-lactamase family protein [Lysobacter sp. GX 14042]
MNAARATLLALAAALASPAAALVAVDAAPAATEAEAEIRDAAWLDRQIGAVVDHYALPGIAVGVIEDGRITHVHTSGERVVDSGQPVTPATLFKIASNSKAMTASLLARLVDAGKLAWDDPVTRHLPQFRMHDPWVTAHMQVRDLLIHNSGLPEGAGDLMLWPEPNDFGRADIINGLAHLKPERSFRSGYAYDNLLYVVAGEVAAAAGGDGYEALVRREVFEPLGLSRCQVGEFDRDAVGDIAQPHMRQEGRHVAYALDPSTVPAITSAAAGGIRCSVEDMLTWALAWLRPESAPGWLSHAQREAMWTAHTPLPVGDRDRLWRNTHLRAYGYGWRLADAHGLASVSHTGTLGGMYSVLHLLPERNAGFVVLINGSGAAARTVLDQVLLDYLAGAGAGREAGDYIAELSPERGTTAAQQPAPDVSARQPATPEAMAGWLGHWRDPWFGEVRLCPDGNTVRFQSAKSPRLAGVVMEVAGGRLVDWDADSVDAEAWISLDASEAPPTLRMAKVDPQADFSYDYEDLAFTRAGGCKPD